MSEWKETTLGDVLNFRRGHDLPKINMVAGDIPVAGSNGIIGWHNVATDISPCLTIGRSGSVGKPNLYKKAWAHNTVLYVDDFKGNDPQFLYYLIQTLPLREFQAGSAVPTLNRNHIHPFTIKFPIALAVQKKIASLLSSLDAKIETNRAINARLEELAAAIFKSWFIDFEPFGGQIPDNWKKTNIGSLNIEIYDFVANGSFASLKENVKLYDKPEYAYFIRNTDLKTNSFSVYVDEHSYNFLSKSRLFGGEIIISNVGDVGSVFICPVLDRPMTLGNNTIMLRPAHKELTYYLYLFFRSYLGQHLLDSITGGSAQPKFNKTDFKRSILTIPDIETLCQFHAIIKSLLTKFECNIKESARLSSLRDILLPRLMSGELIPE